jgi:hypothetical protein
MPRTATQRTGTPRTGTQPPVTRQAVTPRTGTQPPGTRQAVTRQAVTRQAAQRASAQRTAERAERAAAEQAERAWATSAVSLPRMPFVLLVLALLGGGLICLLVINTTLGATSFRITQLQSTNASLSVQHQTLQNAIANEEAPGQIARRAYALGMRWQSQLNFLNPVTGRIYHVGARGLGTVDPLVPAATAKSAGTPKNQNTAKDRHAVKPSAQAKSGHKATAAGSAGPGSAR